MLLLLPLRSGVVVLRRQEVWRRGGLALRGEEGRLVPLHQGSRASRGGGGRGLGRCREPEVSAVVVALALQDDGADGAGAKGGGHGAGDMELRTLCAHCSLMMFTNCASLLRPPSVFPF